MSDRKIVGAVALGDRVYKAGDEDALAEAFGGKAPGAHLLAGDRPALSGDWGAAPAKAADDEPKGKGKK